VIEKKLIEFMHETNENMNVTYSNRLAAELLEIIKLQHVGLTFKGKKYSDSEKLHYNMAKYYVKAFQVYYAIKKIKKLTIVPEMHDVKNIDLQLVEGIDVHSFNTFPSGHTLTAFTSIFLFQFLFTGLKNWQIFLLFVLAMGCGLSRIILAQHWPQDVLGGLILGILAGLSGVFISYKLFPQMERPSADIII
jgi:hypothetical protein